MSWTGSESQRRRGGGCSSNGTRSRPRFVPDLAPARPLFCVPSGTAVVIRRLGEKAWREYVTQRRLLFLAFEDLGQEVVFVQQGWDVKVSKERLIAAE